MKRKCDPLMEKIEGINLSELIDDTSLELFHERKHLVVGKIKVILTRINALKMDIKNAETVIKKRKEGIAKMEHKVAQLRAGDWSVLEEDKPQQEKKTEDE
jgi:hypothetical protein